MPSHDSWKTQLITLEGGVILNEGPLEQGSQRPGSLLTGINFEASIEGGYRRISGVSRYSNSVVPGSGQVLGTFVFNGGVVAMRGTAIYYGTGTSWTMISSDTRTGAGKYRATKNTTNTQAIIVCDGVNFPAMYDDAATYTVLSNAPATMAFPCMFEESLFLASPTSSVVQFSMPGDPTDFNALDGAGEINVGFNVTGGLAVWRSTLYVFGDNNIASITGQNATNFALVPVTSNIGCSFPDTIQEVGGDLVYLAPDGIRTIAGTMRIDDVDLSNLSRTVQSKTNNLISSYKGGQISTLIIRNKAQYRILTSNSTTLAASTMGLIGSIRLGLDGSVGWEWFDLVGLSVYCCHSAYLGSQDVELCVHANADVTDGYVYQQESGPNFVDKSNNIVSVPWQLQLCHNPFDDSALRKTLFRIAAYIRAEGTTSQLFTNTVLDLGDPSLPQPASLSLGFLIGPSLYDTDATYDGAFVYDAVDLYKVQTPAIGSGKTISIGIGGQGGYPFTIKSLYVEYALNGRR